MRSGDATRDPELDRNAPEHRTPLGLTSWHIPWNNRAVNVRSAIKEALSLLSSRDRRLLWISTIVQMSTSVLDLIGVLLIGLVGALAVATVQSLPPPELVQNIMQVVGLEGLSNQQLVGYLALAAAVVLLTKSLVSSYLTRRVLAFLANRQAIVSARLAQGLLSQPLTFVQLRSSQETSFALIQGVGAATMSMLGQLTIAMSEFALLMLLSAALLLINPWITVGAIAFFAAVAWLLQRAMGRWASRVGSESAEAEISSLNAVQEAVNAYREVVVADRRDLYVNRIQAFRWQAARVYADMNFIGMLPKYMFEAALVVGGFALAALLFTTQGAASAVGTLALYLAAASRVMPSLLRLQGAALTMRSAAGIATPTFALARDLGKPTTDPNPQPTDEAIRTALRRGHPGLNPTISISNVGVTYVSASRPALQGVTFRLEAGQSLALVGSSGAGKSTLADVLLGVLSPDTGEALIGDVPPSQAVARWPGGIGYVPQNVVLANDTIRANVALGLPRSAVDDDMVLEALERAHLADYLLHEREGLNTLIGESGLRLSGGQRQRLGIARALFTKPRILVLDEATSALDADSEFAISETIQGLEGSTTTVIIAHRLSTVRHVDLLLYLSEGRVVGQGTFAEVRASVPDLDRQASLMGL